MAKLTISEAAALTQVNRSTLHRAMKQGRLSRDPDGRLDTAELLRAGFQLHAPTPPPRATVQHGAMPQGRATVQRDATPPPSVAQQTGNTASHIEIAALQRECALLQHQLDTTRTMLQHQVDATRELLQSERQATQDRERRAADREALLLHMLQEAQQRFDRLLEAPKPAPSPPSAPVAPPPALAPAPETADYRGFMRQRVLQALQGYPQGRTRGALEEAVGASKPLTNVLQGMRRDGLLVRVQRGRYALPGSG